MTETTPYPLTISECWFWKIVWGCNPFQIARRFNISEAVVKELLSPWHSLNRTKKKFERWAKKTAQVPIQTDNYIPFVSSNDLSFHELVSGLIERTGNRDKYLRAIARIRNNEIR